MDFVVSSILKLIKMDYCRAYTCSQSGASFNSCFGPLLDQYHENSTIIETIVDYITSSILVHRRVCLVSADELDDYECTLLLAKGTQLAVWKMQFSIHSLLHPADRGAQSRLIVKNSSISLAPEQGYLEGQTTVESLIDIPTHQESPMQFVSHALICCQLRR